jgi:hypothetical protein
MRGMVGRRGGYGGGRVGGVVAFSFFMVFFVISERVSVSVFPMRWISLL